MFRNISKDLITFAAVGAVLASWAFKPVSAWACPNLAGTYSCPADQSGSGSTTVITQTMQKDVTVYVTQTTENGKTSSTTLIADGVQRETPDGAGDGKTIPVSYTCEGDRDLRMDSFFDILEIGSFTLEARISLDAQKNMRMVADTKVEDLDPHHTDVTCKRQ
jgi:hypothetical protein